MQAEGPDLEAAAVIAISMIDTVRCRAHFLPCMVLGWAYSVHSKTASRMNAHGCCHCQLLSFYAAGHVVQMGSALSISYAAGHIDAQPAVVVIIARC